MGGVRDTAAGRAASTPQGLRWGMQFAESSAQLRSEGAKVEKAKRRDSVGDGISLPDSCTAAELKDARLFDQDLKEAWLVFDRNGGLCGLVFQLKFGYAPQDNNRCIALAQRIAADASSVGGVSSGGELPNNKNHQHSSAAWYQPASRAGVLLKVDWEWQPSSGMSRFVRSTMDVAYGCGNWMQFDPQILGM